MQKHEVKRIFKKTIKHIFMPIYNAFLNFLPDRPSVILNYIVRIHAFPNIDYPRTFNEKIAWRKLFDRDARFPQLADKVKAKENMAQKFGIDFVIPNLCVCETPEQFPFDELKPPYVIKLSHSSSDNIFIKDDNFNRDKIIRQLRKQLNYDHGRSTREWAYSKIDRKILVEPFIQENLGQSPMDYKFHVFNGNVGFVELAIARFSDSRCDIYSPQWEVIPVVYGDPNSDKAHPKPENYDQMLRYAEEIGRDFSYCRVDLYNVKGKILFGEVTFYPGAGNAPFSPSSWDKFFGDMWKIST